LLLFISCTIVLRSFIVRRRFRRQIEEAVAAGIILAPRVQGSRKRRYGHKPKMFTSWVMQGGEKWDEMMPVSALPVQAKRRYKNPTSSLSKHEDPHQPQPTSTSEPFSWRLLQGIHRRDQITAEQPVIVQHEKLPRVKIDMLQISVLIAMPSPNNPMDDSTSTVDEKSEDDGQIPDVVFGVTRLPFKHSNHIS